VNAAAPLDPPDVVTVTARLPTAASVATVNVAVIDVGLATVTLETDTPLPLTATLVPATKFDPVIVWVNDVPVTPALALRLAIVGAGGLIVKPCVPLVPPVVVTLIVRPPSAALDPTTRSAVMDVALTTFVFCTVMSAPLTATVVELAEMKLPPVSVTVVVAPRTTIAGVTPVSAGTGGLIVNVCAPLVPALVVTVRLRAPNSAVDAIVSVTVSMFSLATLTEDAVTPVPLTATVVPPVTKFAPTSVSVVVVPCTPVLFDSDVIVGAGNGAEVWSLEQPAAIKRAETVNRSKRRAFTMCIKTPFWAARFRP